MKKIIFLIVALVLLISCSVLKPSSQDNLEKYDPIYPTTIVLSEKEKIVDDKLNKMKEEAVALYPENIPFGIIDWNEDTPIHEELRNFCIDLPKGGDLHVHDEKFVPVDRYIKLLKEYGKVYIVLEEGDTYGFMYIGDVPDNAVSINEALEKGLLTEEELRENLVISDNDIPYGRWASFEKIFDKVMGVNTDSEFLRQVYEEGFRSCCENNVFLIEIRSILFGNEEEVGESIKVIREAYYNVKKEYPDLTVKVIGNSGKNDFFDIEFATGILRSVINLSKTIKDESDPSHVEEFIIGLDLVNEEDVSKPLSEYEDFFKSDEVKNSGLKLYLHAGESLRTDNENVIDAYEFGSSRVGHGFNLYRFPKLMEEYKKEKIVLEVCPISNYRLGYVSDLRLHPAVIYLNEDIPMVISSDDGLFLSRISLTDDYYAAILSWNLDLAKIKELTRNAIVYSDVSKEEEKRLLEKWEKDWNSFIEKYSK